MNVRKFAVLLIVFLLTWAMLYRGSQAQLNNNKLQEETLIRIGTRVEDFLSDVARDNVDDALDTLLARSPLLKDAKKVSQLKESVRREMPKYGVFMGVEQLKLERVGRSIVRCVYVYHCLDYPVAWNLTFYRSEEEGDWNLISLQFNVDYEKLPEAS